MYVYLCIYKFDEFENFFSGYFLLIIPKLFEYLYIHVYNT